jgi:type VI secretion system protein ImpC
VALPRTLLRQPYGPRSDPVQLGGLPFEEAEGGGLSLSELLWGHPAYALARLLARSYLEAGWEMEPGDHLELDRLPSWTVQREGERELQPCAEVLLSQKQLEALASLGLMGFAASTRQNAVRLLRFQSIAEPSAPLAGRWRCA